MKCNNNCTLSLIKIKKTSLFEHIEIFLSKNDFKNLKDFYNEIHNKYKINCEKGMLFIEFVIFYKAFNLYKLINNDKNKFINEKIKLYDWIEIRHLKIEIDDSNKNSIENYEINKNIDLKNIINIFKNINNFNTPSIKIYYFMCSIQELYIKIGKNSSFDKFFTYFIFIIIKSQVKNIYIQIKFMKEYRRKFYGQCGNTCNHNFSINIECSCLKGKDWNNEDLYYLITAEAALEYISRIEYKNLNIEIKEYDNNIILNK